MEHTISHSSAEIADVIANVPWWGTQGVLYVIIVFVLTAVVWCSFSRLDIVAQGRGTLLPQGNVKPVQTASSGVVQTLFVKEGDEVKRDQPLVQLDAAEMRTRVLKLREELRTKVAQLRQTMVSRPFAETLEQQNRIAALQRELSAAELMLQHTTVVSPVSGTITTISLRGAGEVVQPGQTIATVSPAGVPLVVEVQLPNKEIAFVERGLPVKLKFDAFPFQDYGIVQGTVIDVSPDSEVEKDAEASYKVTIAPTNQGNLQLRPGLLVSAEIITEQKNILSYLLSPVRKLRSELSQ